MKQVRGAFCREWRTGVANGEHNFFTRGNEFERNRLAAIAKTHGVRDQFIQGLREQIGRAGERALRGCLHLKPRLRVGALVATGAAAHEIGEIESFLLRVLHHVL